MDLKLKDKVAIVTGAGGDGFGTGVCLELAREGAHVVANDIDRQAAEKVAEQARKLGARAIPTFADLTKLDDCRKMVDDALAEFGRVDILVTVPAYTVLKKFVEQNPDEWHKQVDVTFWGAIHPIRAALDPMLRQKSGSIVCVGSDAGKVGERMQTMYGASKGAIMAFAKALAKEHGTDGIRINVVSSGLNKTGAMSKTDWLAQREKSLVKAYPIGRLGVPQDMVNVIVFLASDLAGYVTGQTLSVSGGYTMQ